MEKFWTSSEPIHGLRHFVLVNEIKEKGESVFLMVSVIDSEINLKITYKELSNSFSWKKGWIDIPKTESITKDYVKYKSLKREKETNKIFLSDDSLFNIS